jgi:hypothetical protein
MGIQTNKNKYQDDYLRLKSTDDIINNITELRNKYDEDTIELLIIASCIKHLEDKDLSVASNFDLVSSSNSNNKKR